MATTLAATITTIGSAAGAGEQNASGQLPWGSPSGPSESRQAQDLAKTRLSSGSLYRGHTAEEWATRFRHRTRQLQLVRTHLHQRWHPTVLYALKLASAVTGVSYWQLYTVSRCESGHNPFAQNGQYKGLFQMHWAPFGFSPFDPVANALSAAMTVVHDGGWRQWECRP